ncbi:hypothetical protein CARUB_v10018320mg [Capsella rubella]|uniref:Uncharacterized protein n=1 Tax=Capsella rubella TaxID=81985 RepID=R0FR39_9BRAS|nr:hypothetical protein CARUB_v10018320mg [Capsella rubella]
MVCVAGLLLDIRILELFKKLRALFLVFDQEEWRHVRASLEYTGGEVRSAVCVAGLLLNVLEIWNCSRSSELCYYFSTKRGGENVSASLE